MNGGDGNPQTPFQEAISLITIIAILVGVGAYVAALKNVPLLSRRCFGWQCRSTICFRH